MGWATAYIAKLKAGETVSFRPRGHSMSGKIESGQLCTVEPVTDGAADEYFATRPRDSQVGAWASDQSRPLDSLEALDERYRAVAQRLEGEPVPRPPHWSGYVLRPTLIEFWSERPHRLHERRVFRIDGDDWSEGMLYP